MMELTEKAALVSLKQWQAIHDEVQKTIASQENSMHATDEPQTATTTSTQHPPA